MIDKKRTAAHYGAMAARAKELQSMGLLGSGGGGGGGGKKGSGCLGVLVLLAIADTALGVMAYYGLKAMGIL